MIGELVEDSDTVRASPRGPGRPFGRMIVARFNAKACTSGI